MDQLNLFIEQRTQSILSLNVKDLRTQVLNMLYDTFGSVSDKDSENVISFFITRLVRYEKHLAVLKVKNRILRNEAKNVALERNEAIPIRRKLAPLIIPEGDDADILSAEIRSLFVCLERRSTEVISKIGSIKSHNDALEKFLVDKNLSSFSKKRKIEHILDEDLTASSIARKIQKTADQEAPSVAPMRARG